MSILIWKVSKEQIKASHFDWDKKIYSDIFENIQAKPLYLVSETNNIADVIALSNTNMKEGEKNERSFSASSTEFGTRKLCNTSYMFTARSFYIYFQPINK